MADRLVSRRRFNSKTGRMEETIKKGDQIIWESEWKWRPGDPHPAETPDGIFVSLNARHLPRVPDHVRASRQDGWALSDDE